ncbi:MAG: FAD-dependent oxidoreductase [Candidatus Aenigmarchaeota archaeon]|nr:FAD-dependent oxidoreductase [Candidatus Aenigmarchaeota archaeon]
MESKLPDGIYDIAIVGGGVVGFAAAMYAGRFNLKTILFGDSLGGTIILTDVVENYPGFKRVTGLELAKALEEHAREYDVEIKEEKVAKVEGSGNCYRLWDESGGSYYSKAIIFATGTKVRKLGVPGEEEYANRGVHYCALCDGPIYKDKALAVVGGSDSAAKEALLLSQFGRKVYIIYRGENIRPEPINGERVARNPKIEVITQTNVKEIKGKDGKIAHLVLDKPYKGNNIFPVDAVFIEIGHLPLSDLAKGLGVKLNGKGEIIIDRESKTNIPGIFAAGDVVDTKFKQAITGVGEAVSACYSAYQYINTTELVCLVGDGAQNRNSKA